MQKSLTGTKIFNTFFVLFLLVVYIGAIVLGLAYVLSTRKEYIGKTRQALIDKGNAATAFIDSKDLTGPEGHTDEVSTDTRAEVNARLDRLVETSGKAHWACIIIPETGDMRVFYTSDGAGEVNSEMDFRQSEINAFNKAIVSNSAQIVGPEEIPGMTTISTFSPIADSVTGKPVAILIINYPDLVYYEEVDKHTFHAVLMASSVLVVLGCLYWFVLQNRRLAHLTRESQTREKLFRTIFEKTPIGIGMMNNFNTLSAVNKTYLEIFGRSEKDLRQLSWADLTHPSDLEEDLIQFRRLQNGEIDDYSMEKRFIRPDGSIVWVHMIVIRFVMEGHREHTHLCILQDISKRKETELAFREAERSKSVLLSHLPGMAYRCQIDDAWTMEFASEGCFDLTGYTSTELVDNQLISFNDLIVPEYRSVLRKEWDRVLALREPFKAEYEVLCKDGNRKWVLELGQGVLGEYGQIEALEGIIIDMTERKQQEEHIQYLNDHDFLTGLYNRRFFDHEKENLDIKENMPLSFIICDINGVRLINDAFGQIHGDRVIIETSRLLRSFCGERDILARTGGNEFSILLPNTNNERAHELLQRIDNTLEQINRVPRVPDFGLSLAIGIGTKNSTHESLPDVMKEATDYMYSRKLLDRKSSHSSILSAVVATVYERSQETEAHALRLSDISKKIAAKLSLTQKEIDELEVFAMLHDIGKVGIDDRILNKPGKLTDDEWIVMKRHPEIGYRIAMASPELEVVAEDILSHHERWDGKGYPRGLSGEEIPLLARIISVADAYDAMTEDRVYRKGMSRDAAVEEIGKNSGTQFDPRIVTLFMEIIDEVK